MFRDCCISTVGDFAEAKLLPRGAPKRIVVLDAYLDESGIDGPRWLAVAGVIGLTTVFRAFEQDWRSILDVYRVPEFHASTFFGRRSKPEPSFYTGWSTEKSVAFVADLIRLTIGKYPIVPLGSAIDTEAFKSCTVHEREYLTGGYWLDGKWRFRGAATRPYYAPFQAVLASCVHSSDGRRVDVFHDEQHVLARHALRIHARIRKQHPHQFGPIVFGSKRDFVALQAADLIAYCSFQVVARGGSNPIDLVVESPEMYVALKALQRALQITIIDKERLKSDLALLPAEIREGRTRHQMWAALRQELGRKKQRLREKNKGSDDDALH